MAAPLKGKLAKIVQTNTRSDEFKEFMVSLDDFLPADVEPLTVADMNKKLHNCFIRDVEVFLDKYTPVYNDTKELRRSVLELDNSVQRTEQFVKELQKTSKLLSEKISKYRTNEKSITTRIDILDELVQSSQLEKEKLGIIIGEQIRIDDSFFEAFENLNKIRELDGKFREMNLQSKPLAISLQKNLSEIRTIGLSKVTKFLGKNLESVDANKIQRCLKLIKPNSDLYDNTITRILVQRKNKFKVKFKDTFRNFGEKLEIFLNNFNAKEKILITSIREELELYYDQNSAVDPKVVDGLFNEIFRDLSKIIEDKLKKEETFYQVFRACNYMAKFYEDFLGVVKEYGRQNFVLFERSSKALLTVKALAIAAENRFKDLTSSTDNKYWKRLNENLLSFNHNEILSELWQILNYIQISCSTENLPAENRADYVLRFVIKLDDLTLPINRFLNKLLSEKEKEPYSYLIAINIIQVVYQLLKDFEESLINHFPTIKERCKILEERNSEFKDMAAAFFAHKFLTEHNFDQIYKKLEAEFTPGMLEVSNICKLLVVFFEKKKEIYLEELDIVENESERQNIKEIFNKHIIQFFNKVQAQLLRFAGAEIVDEAAVNKLKAVLKWPTDKTLIIPIQQEVEHFLP